MVFVCVLDTVYDPSPTIVQGDVAADVLPVRTVPLGPELETTNVKSFAVFVATYPNDKLEGAIENTGLGGGAA